MRGDDIIDVDVDPKEARRQFWRRIGRFGIPLAGVVLIVGSFEIGASGRAMILDAEGRLVAFPDPAAVVDDTTDGEFRRTHIDAIGDPVLAEAHERIRVAGAGRSIVEIDGRRYIVAASLLAEPAARD